MPIAVAVLLGDLLGLVGLGVVLVPQLLGDLLAVSHLVGGQRLLGDLLHPLLGCLALQLLRLDHDLLGLRVDQHSSGSTRSVTGTSVQLRAADEADADDDDEQHHAELDGDEDGVGGGAFADADDENARHQQHDEHRRHIEPGAGGRERVRTQVGRYVQVEERAEIR